MSTEPVKKQRKVDDGHEDEEGAALMAVDDVDVDGQTTMDEILAEMKHIRGQLSEVDSMKLEINDMKLEMNDMRGRLSRMDELESNCKWLKAECGSLERSLQILIKEQKWEYSAPSIPTFHWINNGFEGQYIEGMECLLRQLKGGTIVLRSGKHNIQQQHIELSGGFEDEDDETILLHDDLLLPHWMEIANALQLYHNSSRLLNLSICNLQLLSLVIDLLAQALKGKTILKSFGLDRNEFVNEHSYFVNTRKGIDFAVDIIGDNPKLERFYWLNNDIDRMEDARYLVDAIISHPRVQHIRLDNCFGDDINGYDAFRCLFTCGKSFSHIALEGNEIRTGGSTEISDYLATNPPLKKLYLAGNHLDDDDAILIARALKRNYSLQHLHLGDNDLTEEGENALSNALYDSTSLNSMVDCNHSCKISGIAIPVNVSVNHPGITPKCNRAFKIYHLLALRNREGSNVEHLNLEFGNDDDESLALVPNVLASVQQYYHSAMFARHDYSNQVHPLSIMYEILRSWKMPALYENCGMPKA